MMYISVIYITKILYFGYIIIYWSLINGLISKNFSHSEVKEKSNVNNVEFSNDEKIVQVFNEYFCSIGK